MPAVGKGWQRCWHGRLEVPSLQRASHPPCVLLAGPPLQSLEKKREKRGAKNGRGDGEIAGTEEKFGDSIISPTKDGTLIAQLPCSPFPHSLCFLVMSLSFLGKALAGKDLYGLLGLSAILGLLKKLPV